MRACQTMSMVKRNKVTLWLFKQCGLDEIQQSMIVNFILLNNCSLVYQDPFRRPGPELQISESLQGFLQSFAVLRSMRKQEIRVLLVLPPQDIYRMTIKILFKSVLLLFLS